MELVDEVISQLDEYCNGLSDDLQKLDRVFRKYMEADNAYRENKADDLGLRVVTCSFEDVGVSAGEAFHVKDYDEMFYQVMSGLLRKWNIASGFRLDKGLFWHDVMLE